MDIETTKTYFFFLNFKMVRPLLSLYKRIVFIKNIVLAICKYRKLNFQIESSNDIKIVIILQTQNGCSQMEFI